MALRICQPCSALDFKGVGNKVAMHDSILWEKLNKTSVKCRKLPVEAGQSRGLTALPKPLVAIAELKCDLCQHQKWLATLKKPYLDPWNLTVEKRNIEGCHSIGNGNRTTIRFVNREFCNVVIDKTHELKKIDNAK